MLSLGLKGYISTHRPLMARSLVNPADFWICGQNSMVGNRSSWYEVVSIRPQALKLYKKISITPIIVCASWTRKTFGVTIHRSVSQLVTPRLIKLVSKRAVNPWCHRWNETPVGELLHSTIYFLGFYKKKSDFFWWIFYLAIVMGESVRFNW